MTDISSLYPQAPQPPQNGLALNPGQMLDLVQKSRAIKANQAIGNAFQGAIGPDGNFDPNAAMTAIKGNPDAAYAAPEAIGSVLDARNKNITNATGQFNLLAGQSKFIQDTLGPLAQTPDVTKADLAGAFATLARGGVPPEMLNSTYAGLPNDPKSLHRWLANTNASALGAAGASTRINTAPSPTGAAQTTSVAAAAYGNPTTPTENAPGVGGAIAAPQVQYIADKTAVSDQLAAIRPLEQAVPLLRQLSNSSFGPGSNELQTFRQALQTAGLISPDSTAATMADIRSEVGKKLSQNAILTPGGSRSNEGLAAAFNANPGLFLSKPSNINLVIRAIGMVKQDAAMVSGYDQEHPDAATNPAARQDYINYKANHYQTTDDRAFGFGTMDPVERRALIDSLGPASTPNKPNPVYDKFMRSIKIARAANLIMPDQAPADGQ